MADAETLMNLEADEAAVREFQQRLEAAFLKATVERLHPLRRHTGSTRFM